MDFAEARRAYTDLGKKHFAGKLSRADYHTEVRSLTATDDEGRRWRINSETGAWQRLVNGRWVDDDPEKSARRGKASPASAAYDEEQVPFEVVLGMVFVLLVMIAAWAIAYALLNAAR